MWEDHVLLYGGRGGLNFSRSTECTAWGPSAHVITRCPSAYHLQQMSCQYGPVGWQWCLGVGRYGARGRCGAYNCSKIQGLSERGPWRGQLAGECCHHVSCERLSRERDGEGQEPRCPLLRPALQGTGLLRRTEELRELPWCSPGSAGESSSWGRRERPWQAPRAGAAAGRELLHSQGPNPGGREAAGGQQGGAGWRHRGDPEHWE